MTARSISGQGVTKFVAYRLKVFMPKDHESCVYCPCIQYDRDKDARVCKWTHEVLFPPYSMRGVYCPLEEEKEREDR